MWGGEELRRGKVDRSRVPTGLKQHELDTVQRIANRGHDVTFIPPHDTKTADVTIDGQPWELKSVTGANPTPTQSHAPSGERLTTLRGQYWI